MAGGYDLTILEFAKADLGKTSAMPTAQENLLRGFIESAMVQIAREGASLDISAVDDQITVAMYAAWLYRKRALNGKDSGMPRMLRYRLNNLILNQKGQV